MYFDKCEARTYKTGQLFRSNSTMSPTLELDRV